MVNGWEAKLPGTKRGTQAPGGLRRPQGGLAWLCEGDRAGGIELGGRRLGIGEGIEPVLSFSSVTETLGVPARWLCV